MPFTAVAPCELLKHRPATATCAFRRRQAQYDMVPAGPLMRWIGTGWTIGGDLAGSRFSRLPAYGIERRQLLRARRSGWVSEQTADRVLTLFGDGDLAREWWGDRPAMVASGPSCPRCGVEMLRPADACGFCDLEP